jgi:hypothetical protein
LWHQKTRMSLWWMMINDGFGESKFTYNLRSCKKVRYRENNNWRIFETNRKVIGKRKILTNGSPTSIDHSLKNVIRDFYDLQVDVSIMKFFKPKLDYTFVSAFFIPHFIDIRNYLRCTSAKFELVEKNLPKILFFYIFSTVWNWIKLILLRNTNNIGSARNKLLNDI